MTSEVIKGGRSLQQPRLPSNVFLLELQKLRGKSASQPQKARTLHSSFVTRQLGHKGRGIAHIAEPHLLLRPSLTPSSELQKGDILLRNGKNSNSRTNNKIMSGLLERVLTVDFLVAAKPTTLIERQIHLSFFLSFFLSSFFLIKVQRKAKTVQTNMGTYVVWAINFVSEVRSDLRGCLVVTVASKPHFLCWSLIDGPSHNEPISPKLFKNPLKFL